MPVGTKGAVKTVGAEDLEALGYRLLLANTYHLALRPGEEVIERLGGLNRFMGWPHPILTDSGGYQIMSLAAQRKLSERGVEFRSHLDGTALDLTPERAVRIQRRLGVDISMALDVCPPYPAPREEVAQAMRLTHTWAGRSLEARSDGQTLFGIVQGGTHEDHRRESAEQITSFPFDGFAVGGVSVGEETELQRAVVEMTAPMLPDDKPRYLMGVGRPNDIIHAVECGVDLFDCVLPTRLARHRALFTLNGVINITNAEWTEHNGPPDPESVFPLVQRYSAAYIRHLFLSDDPLAQRLATLHNLAFYARLMAEIREAVIYGTWGTLKKRYANA